ncbi:hypothetical protein BJ165DRAFT_376984 [Panaeolus papilionaceus]|nr:hypothetical protein BJ165DRAFT_376984 [Panaeolus papilionaceus]
MLSLRSFLTRARSVTTRTYYTVKCRISSLPWRIQRRRRVVKEVARIYRTKLRQKHKRTKHTIYSWSSRRKRSVHAALNPKTPGLPSPVPHLQVSNDPPDEEEAKMVCEAIERTEARLKSHKKDLWLQSYWASAGAPKPTPQPIIAHLEENLSCLESIRSSIRRFPAELLRDMFVFGLYPRPHAPEIHTPDDLVDWPWTVSQVCQRWRNVALSMPELWCYLPTFRIERIQFSGDIRRQQAMLQLMILRSQDRGLHLAVKGYISGKKPPRNPTINLLVQHAERWETASMRLSGAQLNVFRGIKGRLPRLTRLRLSVWHSMASAINMDRDMFSIAPKLQEVSSNSHYTAAPRFPQAQLVRCSLRCCSSESQMRALFSSANILRELQLESSRIPVLSTSITLPKLERFCFSINSYDDVGGLHNLITPALEECYVDGSHGDILTALLALFGRSSQTIFQKHPLKKLAFSRDTSSLITSQSATFISILELTSGIQSLECPLPSLDTLFRLTQVDSTDILVPSMKCCRFLLSSTLTREFSSAVNALAASRCEIGNDDLGFEGSFTSTFVQPLEYLTLQAIFPSPPYDDDLSECQHHLEELWEQQSPRVTRRDNTQSLTSTLDAMEDTDQPEEKPRDEATLLRTLRDLIDSALPGETRYETLPISEIPFSKLHISRQQATALISHLTSCREARISIQSLAVFLHITPCTSMIR